MLCCVKAFRRAGDLRRHVRGVHMADKPVTCSLCGHGFGQSNELRAHLRYVHSASRPHECNCCAKRFKAPCDLARHVRIHTDARPYQCTHCAAAFRRADQLKVTSHRLISLLLCSGVDPGMWSRSRGLGLETVSRTNNVSSRSLAISCCWSRRFVHAVWRSIVVVVPYRPICLCP